MIYYWLKKKILQVTKNLKQIINFEFRISNQFRINECYNVLMNDGKYDLEKRTTTFSKEIVKFCRLVTKDIVTTPIISQLVRSGTSIGANYKEANSASSRKDFRNKIHISKKEAEETMYWLEVIATADPNSAKQGRILWSECKEIVLIFGKILSSLGKNGN